jgi:hypothetical protein
MKEEEDKQSTNNSEQSFIKKELSTNSFKATFINWLESKNKQIFLKHITTLAEGKPRFHTIRIVF